MSPDRSNWFLPVLTPTMLKQIFRPDQTVSVSVQTYHTFLASVVLPTHDLVTPVVPPLTTKFCLIFCCLLSSLTLTYPTLEVLGRLVLRISHVVLATIVTRKPECP